MHREPLSAPPVAPGLTPLTGRYVRRGELWYCTREGPDSAVYLTDHDDSDGGATRCYRVSSIAEVAKLAYYAAKLLKTFVPPP